MAGILLDVVLGRPRHLAEDARRALGEMPVQPQIEGAHHIPTAGPAIIVANHYERPGLWVVWGALLVTAAAAERRAGQRPVRWVHVSEWTRFNVRGLVLPTAFTRWLIGRARRTWGVLPIPPPGGSGAAGARALLRVARVVTDGRGELVGIFPEGGPSVALRPALPGSGAFLLSLAERGVPLIPVGLSEPGGILTAHFGPAFLPSAPAGLPTHERDALARREIMLAIARLLPDDLRGPF